MVCCTIWICCSILALHTMSASYKQVVMTDPENTILDSLELLTMALEGFSRYWPIAVLLTSKPCLSHKKSHLTSARIARELSLLELAELGFSGYFVCCSSFPSSNWSAIPRSRRHQYLARNYGFEASDVWSISILRMINVCIAERQSSCIISNGRLM